MSARTDPALVRSAKRLLPAPAKDVALRATRAYGMLTGPLRRGPDYYLIGAKRCGSTSLHSYLLEHPDVRPLFPAAEHRKGVHWYDREPTRSVAWYRSHFPVRRPGDRSLVGDASTYYFLHPRAARRAAQQSPDARVLCLLREPVERAFSHYRDEVKNGHETLDFATAIAAEPDRLAPELDRLARDPGYYSFVHEHLSYVSWGHYAQHLSRWVDAFGAERVLVLRSEDLFTRPEEVYARVLRFLGLGPFTPRFRRHNAAPPGVREDAVTARLSEHYAPHNDALLRLIDGAPAWT